MTTLRASQSSTVTLAKVAKVAGVATSTVSHVLTNRPGVIISPETRDRVTRVAQSMGYRPNLAARALRGGATHTLGFIDSVLEIEVVATRCSAFEDAARKGGYLTTMSFNHPQDPVLENRLLQSLRSRCVDGIVIQPVIGSTLNTELRQLIRDGFPIVTLHGEDELGPACCVDVDYTAGGYLQGRHLVELGRKRICHVTRGGPYPSVVQRVNGLRTALDEAGCPPIMTALLRSDTQHFHRTEERDYQDLRRFFRENRGRIDAIVGINDEYALCAMRAALDEGMRVPEDVAVVGFDGITACRLAAVPMTTVKHPAELMAEKAFELVTQLVSGTRKATEVERVMLKPTLIVRQSSVGIGSGGGE